MERQQRQRRRCSLNGQRTLNIQGEELDPIKGVWKGKKPWELIVDLEGDSHRRILGSPEYQNKGWLQRAIIHRVMSLMGESHKETAKPKKTSHKRNFVETSDSATRTIPSSMEEETDASFSGKIKGTQLIPVEELVCFDLGGQKKDGMSQLKEVLSDTLLLSRKRVNLLSVFGSITGWRPCMNCKKKILNGKSRS